jgi:hypothetical protein
MGVGQLQDACAWTQPHNVYSEGGTLGVPTTTGNISINSAGDLVELAWLFVEGCAQLLTGEGNTHEC